MLFQPPFRFSLLAEKQKELGDAANKLRNGLEKIDDTRKKASRCLRFERTVHGDSSIVLSFGNVSHKSQCSMQERADHKVHILGRARLS